MTIGAAIKLRLWKAGVKVSLGTLDLRGADLSGTNFNGADLGSTNLRGVNLREADLSGADLKGAELSEADLNGVNLIGADLLRADLRGANLNGADLIGAKLRETDLRGANLSRANLRKADLNRADLREADLNGADLREADLREANLMVANFRDANLRKAYLRGAHLNGADLMRADLMGADLMGADLMGADLRKAYLNRAVLSGAYLNRVDLREAKLMGAILREAILDQANLSQANLERTDFKNVKMDRTILGLTDLSNCKNLDTVEISGPCIIDFPTLQASKPLPKTFLRKIGLTDNYLEYLPDFFEDNPLRLFPVFLSHNVQDKPFTRKLYEALIDRNAQVWMDEKKIKPGDEIMGSISKAINVYDKMILVCSQQSLNSWWVDQELDRIMEKERQYQKASGTKERLLIPIRIDDSILHWQDSKAASIRKYHIGDFTNWQDPSAFAKALDDLVAALNVDRPDGGIISQLKKD